MPADPLPYPLAQLGEQVCRFRAAEHDVGGDSRALERVGLGHGRPLLLGNVRSRVKTLLDERLPIYLSVARVVVDTDGRSPEEVAESVAAAIEEPAHE